VCKAPHNVWDYISVEDAAEAILAIVDKQYRGIVNIGSGIPRIVGDVFKEIAIKMDAGHLFTFDYENTAKEIVVANTDVLNNTIGYTCKVSFDHMLDDMIADIRERYRIDAR
jgi:nucleoside-diphosphate-sugar epimerase